MVARGALKRKTKRAAIWRKTGGYCWCCGQDLIEHEMIDRHLVPITAGGDNRNSNLVPSCFRCNHAKGHLTLEEFRQKQRGMMQGNTFYGERRQARAG